ncbi:hypothetical protein BDZ89DRAFT_360865 [Hymenopellis radicata]|nr:hypothetical protein BDZ89DRAFT_360865 [Hymenopellis radicata]
MPETIRSLLSMKFSRVHSSAEELASRGMTRDLGPTLSSTQASSSKRSLTVMLSLSSDVVESDRHFFPLYKDLLAWQGPFLDYFLMHLADNLKLKHVKFINNLHRLFAKPSWNTQVSILRSLKSMNSRPSGEGKLCFAGSAVAVRKWRHLPNLSKHTSIESSWRQV